MNTLLDTTSAFASFEAHEAEAARAASAALSVAIEEYFKATGAENASALRAIADAHQAAIEAKADRDEINTLIGQLAGEDGADALSPEAAEYVGHDYICSAGGVTLSSHYGAGLSVTANADLEAEAEEHDRDARRDQLEEGEYLSDEEAIAALGVTVENVYIDPRICIGPDQWQIIIYETDEGYYLAIAGGSEGPVRAEVFDHAQISAANDAAFNGSSVGDADYARGLARELGLLD